MYVHHQTSSQIARERHSDMMKSAQNQRLARQLRTEPGTAQPPARQLRRPLGVVGRLLAAFQA